MPPSSDGPPSSVPASSSPLEHSCVCGFQMQPAARQLEPTVHEEQSEGSHAAGGMKHVPLPPMPMLIGAHFAGAQQSESVLHGAGGSPQPTGAQGALTSSKGA